MSQDNAWALLLEQARLTPHKEALADERDRVFTFEDFVSDCTHAASVLRSAGIDRTSRVALYATSSRDCLVAAFALIRCGAVLVPIDRQFPELAVERMLRVASCTHMLTDGAAPEGVAAIPLDLSARSVGAAPEPTPRDPGEESLILFTSGSTGEPKGVSIAASFFRERFTGHNEDPTSKVVSLFKGSITWICVIPIVELCRGDTVLVMPYESLIDPEAFLRRLLHYEVTEFGTVPSHLRQLTPYRELLGQMRRVYVWGEFITDDLIQTMRDTYPDVEFFDIYSATETLGYGAIRRLSGTDHSYNTGWRADDGYGMCVLDGSNEAAAVGTRGEIAFSGPLATGYVGRPALTKERFVDPARGEGRLYRTGDIGSLAPDGSITLHGREDAQVQIRGVRVELAEIESCAAGVSGVTGAAAFAIVEGSETRGLGLCVTPASVDVEALRAHLARRLSRYAVPNHVAAVDGLPLTASGKLDRRKLHRGLDRRAPTSMDEMEARLAALFSELLEVSPVHGEDDFFELGGHSLLLMQLIAGIGTEFAVRIAPLEATRSPTPAGLAALIRSRRAPAPLAEEDCPAPEAVPLARETLAWFGYRIDMPEDPEEVERWASMTRCLGGHIVFRSFEMPASIDSQERLAAVLTHLFRRHPILCSRLQPQEAPRHLRIVPFRLSDYQANAYGDAPQRQTAVDVYRQLSVLHDVPLVQIHTEGRAIHFALHHILSDQRSREIIETDFLDIAQALEDDRLPAGRLDYALLERHTPTDAEADAAAAQIRPWRLDTDTEAESDRSMMYRIDCPAAALRHVPPRDMPSHTLAALVSALHDVTGQRDGDLMMVVDHRTVPTNADNIIDHIGYLSFIRPIPVRHHGAGQTERAAVLAYYRKALREGLEGPVGDEDVFRVILNYLEDDEPMRSPIQDFARQFEVDGDDVCGVCDFGDDLSLHHVYAMATYHRREHSLHFSIYTSHRRYDKERMVQFCHTLHRHFVALGQAHDEIAEPSTRGRRSEARLRTPP